MPRYQRRKPSKVNYTAIEQHRNQKGFRAVGYARVSTVDQVEKVSLEHQQKEIHKWAVYKGYDIVDMYVDKGESGAKEDRTELTRLMKDAEEGKFDVVVTFSPDRFSRKVRIATQSMYQLDDLGIGLIILNPEIDTRTPMGQMMFNILSHFAEMDRENIKDRLIMGKKDKVKQGRFISRRPYGYNVVSGQLQINEPEASVVKKIFNMRAYEKRSLRKIAEALNQEAIPSPTGKKWSYVSINNILKNETYAGKLTQKVGDEVIQIQMDYTPVVSKSVFGRANSK